MKRFLLFISAFCFAQMGMGQGSIANAPGLLSKECCVRSVTDDMYLTHTLNALGRGVISQHRVSMPQVKNIELPSGYFIRDMKILGDTLYMGGYCVDVVGRHGLLCRLPLSVFDNGGGMLSTDIAPPFEVMPDLISSVTGNNARNRITAISRIEPYRDGGAVNVAFTADNEILIDGIPTYNQVGLGLFTYSINGNDAMFLYNKDMVEHFTDIAVTDNYVVAASYIRDSMYQYLRVFPKSGYLAPTMSVLPSGLTFYQYVGAFCQGMNDQEVISDVRLSALPGDGFITGSLYRSGREHGLSAKTFAIAGDRAVLVQSVNMPGVATDVLRWRMDDVRHNAGSGHVLMLATMAGMPDAVVRSRIFDVDPGNIVVPILHTYAPDHRFLSLDNRPAGGFFAVGEKIMSPLPLYCWRNLGVTPNACGLVDQMRPYKTAPLLYELCRPGNMSKPVFSAKFPFVSVYEDASQVECQ